MIFREDVFNDLQADLAGPLLADEYFADVPVYDLRKENIADMIQESLGYLTAKSDKIGACVVVLPIEVIDDYREATASHPRTYRVTYQVIENFLMNNGSNGTRKSARSIASRIGHVMKHMSLGGFSTGLVPAPGPFIVPVESPDGILTYNVIFEATEIVDQVIYKCEMPQFSYDDVTGILAITCPTPDVTMYYTTDGSYPHPTSSATATAYTAAITIEGEVLVRVAAFKDAHVPSNVNAARFDAIATQDGLGGLLGTEDGGIITQS